MQPRVDVNIHREMLAAHLSRNPEDVVVGWYVFFEFLD